MSKLQAVNVSVPFSRAGDGFSFGLGKSGVVLCPSYPRAVLTDPTPAKSSPSPLNLVKFLGWQILWYVLEGGCPMGQTWNPGTSPTFWAWGVGPLLTFSLHVSGASRIEKISWRKEPSSLWTPENVSNCFGNLGWQHPDCFGKPRVVVPPSIIQWSPRKEILLGNIFFLPKANERQMWSPVFNQWSWNSRTVGLGLGLG